jgi:hypothetical protein
MGNDKANVANASHHGMLSISPALVGPLTGMSMHVSDNAEAGRLADLGQADITSAIEPNKTFVETPRTKVVVVDRSANVPDIRRSQKKCPTFTLPVAAAVKLGGQEAPER